MDKSSPNSDDEEPAYPPQPLLVRQTAKLSSPVGQCAENTGEEIRLLLDAAQLTPEVAHLIVAL